MMRCVNVRRQLHMNSPRSWSDSSSWKQRMNVCRIKPLTFGVVWLTSIWLTHSISSYNWWIKMTFHSKTLSLYVHVHVCLSFSSPQVYLHGSLHSLAQLAAHNMCNCVLCTVLSIFWGHLSTWSPATEMLSSAVNLLSHNRHVLHIVKQKQVTQIWTCLSRIMFTIVTLRLLMWTNA